MAESITKGITPGISMSEYIDQEVEKILHTETGKLRTIESINKQIEELPDFLKRVVKSRVTHALREEALVKLRKKRRKTRTKEETEKVLEAEAVKEKDPDLYRRVKEAYLTGRSLLEIPYERRHPTNLYPYLGIADNLTRTRIINGHKLLIIAYSAMMLDNQLCTSSNGVAILYEKTQEVICDDLWRKSSQIQGVGLDNEVSLQAMLLAEKNSKAMISFIISQDMYNEDLLEKISNPL